MQVVIDEHLRVVTIRHTTVQLLLRGLALLVVGIGLPTLVNATAPDLVALSLAGTIASGLWLVQGLTAVLVLDDDGVTISASRRGRRQLAWSEVDRLASDDGRVRIATRDGRRLDGPPGDVDVLDRALDEATRLGLLPPHLP